MSLCINTPGGLCECRMCWRILNIGSPLVRSWGGISRRRRPGSVRRADLCSFVPFLQNFCSFFPPKRASCAKHPTCLPSKCFIFFSPPQKISFFVQVSDLLFRSAFCLLQRKFKMQQNVAQGQSQWRWARATYCSSDPVTCLFSPPARRNLRCMLN